MSSVEPEPYAIFSLHGNVIFVCIARNEQQVWDQYTHCCAEWKSAQLKNFGNRVSRIKVTEIVTSKKGKK